MVKPPDTYQDAQGPDKLGRRAFLKKGTVLLTYVVPTIVTFTMPRQIMAQGKKSFGQGMGVSPKGKKKGKSQFGGF